jgi:hypothetical protein
MNLLAYRTSTFTFHTIMSCIVWNLRKHKRIFGKSYDTTIPPFWYKVEGFYINIIAIHTIPLYIVCIFYVTFV